MIKAYEIYIEGIRFLVAEQDEPSAVKEAKNLYRLHFGKRPPEDADITSTLFSDEPIR